MKYNELLQIALNASKEAGEAIMDIYNSDDFGVEIKSDESPLTKADTQAHEIIKSHLKQTGIPVLSEEGKAIAYDERKDWEVLWIVDPIDGTKEFIKRNGEFTVNIALVLNQVPVLGVVFAPYLNELYFAAEGLGSYKAEGESLDFRLEELLKVSSPLPVKNNRKKYTVVASKSHMSKETEEYIEELKVKHGELDLISRGSSLKLCMVAEGAADCYPRFAPTMEWDTAAGQAICTFVGKLVLDYTSRQTMIYNRENLLNNWFLIN